MENTASKNERIRPVVVLKPGTMKPRDMKMLRSNGICVVECEDPSALRFIEPPVIGDYSLAERAAISLARVLMTETNDVHMSKINNRALFAEILMQGVPMLQRPVTPAKK